MTATTSSIAQSGGFAPTRNHVFRYVAALGGLVALLAFYQPWVRADLNAIGETPLTGLELARGDAPNRVDLAVFGGSARPGSVSGAPASSASGAASAGSAASVGGLTLPTRQPTAAAGSQGASQVVGGLTLPTRQPTAAAGSAGASQLVGSAATPGTGAATSGVTASPPAGQATATAISNPSLPGGAPIAGAVPPPPPTQPDVLANVLLYLIPVMGLGLAAFSIVWDRLSDLRDRRYGKAWTLIFSIGGALWVGSILYKAATAPPDNSLIGPGVGGVTAAEPALWATFLGFLLAAVCLILAWLSPAPPPPDPYYRVRAHPSVEAPAPSA